ncbi:MAG: hypothetical protein MZV65_02125 [Chromatiales bacterium]|nr:hypothetical protein [Chromatiales bacterium]
MAELEQQAKALLSQLAARRGQLQNQTPAAPPAPAEQPGTRRQPAQPAGA